MNRLPRSPQLPSHKPEYYSFFEPIKSSFLPLTVPSLPDFRHFPLPAEKHILCLFIYARKVFVQSAACQQIEISKLWEIIVTFLYIPKTVIFVINPVFHSVSYLSSLLFLKRFSRCFDFCAAFACSKRLSICLLPNAFRRSL